MDVARREPRAAARGAYRGTSLIRNTPHPGLDRRNIPRCLWWSSGEGNISYERSTPVGVWSSGVRGSGFRVQGTGCRFQGAGFRVHGAWLWMWHAENRVLLPVAPGFVGFGVQGSGCRSQGAGFRVQDAGCRLQGSGCRVQGLRGMALDLAC